MAKDHDLLTSGGLMEDSLGWDRDNLYEIRFGCRIKTHPFCNPLFQSLMSRITFFQPFAATMCDFHEWFLQQQALTRFHDIRPTSVEFGSNRHDVECRIVGT